MDKQEPLVAMVSEGIPEQLALLAPQGVLDHLERQGYKDLRAQLEDKAELGQLVPKGPLETTDQVDQLAPLVFQEGMDALVQPDLLG